MKQCNTRALELSGHAAVTHTWLKVNWFQAPALKHDHSLKLATISRLKVERK